MYGKGLKNEESALCVAYSPISFAFPFTHSNIATEKSAILLPTTVLLSPSFGEGECCGGVSSVSLQLLQMRPIQGRYFRCIVYPQR